MSKLVKILNTLEENQRQIQAFGKFDEQLLKKINYKIRLDWNYYSNRMEGGTLTRDETRSVMVGNIDVQGKPFKDVAEMKGHDQVVLQVLKMSSGQTRISESRIKEIHRAIMHEDDPEKAKLIGQWKTHANEIINYQHEKIAFTPPSEVAEKVQQLLNKTNAELDKLFAGKKAQHPLEIAAQFHIDFVTIHPFYDGNGRTCRILTNILLLACGYPAIIIREEQKEAYYRYLADIQVYNGEADLFYAFIGERILDTQAIILKAINGEPVEEDSDLDKRISLLDKMLTNIEEPITLTRNAQVMTELWDNSIEPLVKTVLEKTQKLSPFFVETIFVYSIYDYNKSFKDVQSLLTELKNDWVLKSKDINNLSLSLNFITLKKLGVKAFDVSLSFSLRFQQHRFLICINNDIILQKLYHQLLTDRELEEFSDNFTLKIVDEIEERIKQQ